jgi:Cysteine dioxygenase type I
MIAPSGWHVAPGIQRSDRLAAMVAAYAATPRLWRAAVRHDTSRRWYVRLAWSTEHEVWLLGWTAGQAVDLHDHGESAGSFVVTEGALCEEHVAGAGVRRVRYEQGAVCSFAAGHVHTVWDPGPGPATSIHAYSPPLRSMAFYAREPGMGLRRTRVERVEGAAP